MAASDPKRRQLRVALPLCQALMQIECQMPGKRRLPRYSFAMAVLFGVCGGGRGIRLF
jgi:hypothetical protein